MHTNLNNYEQEVLDGWEEIYKRGQLTLWILFALADGPKHMADIKEYIRVQTTNVVSADDQSMYRALRRYTETELVTYTNHKVSNGPDRKVYQLTKTGSHVLEAFVERNVKSLVTQYNTVKGNNNEK
jgi:PadR family transcriptional regulator, regulatory protein PadR